jgi:hypothetical protein
MGPECRGYATKKGAKFPKARWKLSGGKMIFQGVAGEVVLPTTVVEEEDEKQRLVRRHLRNGGHIEDTVNALRDYMVEKDSRVTLRWCREFVQRTINQMNAEAEHDLKSKSD